MHQVEPIAYNQQTKESLAMSKPKKVYEGPTSNDTLLGSEHILPPNISWSEYNKLRNKWYDLLQSQGHIDIEYFDRNGKGQASTLFKKGSETSYSGSSATISRNYSTETQEYYRLCGLFLHHADFKAIFGPKARIYKHIFMLHSEGVAYRAIARESHKSSWPFKKDAKHSVFWAHWHLKRIIKAMWDWFWVSEQGQALLNEDLGSGD